MPTFKHPCPYCDKFIDRAVAACPYCGQVDPFAPKRCQNCRKIVEDPAWTVCPSCGQSLIAPPPGTVATGGTATNAGTATPTPAVPPAAQASTSAGAAPAAPPAPRPPLNPDAAAPVLKSAGACSGCGAPLPAGARFCTICGTMAV
ncbi:MAG: zinc ribbon domain-containing protein [Candidatus Limnocylindrales bacterium]|jgi:predicted amidophosphoribosyltransferase